MNDLSLSRTLSVLSEVIRAVEENPAEPGDEIVPVFNTAVADLQSAVDERAALIENLSAYVSVLKKREDIITAKRRSVEKALERIRDRTLEHIEMNPGIEFKGHFHRMTSVKPGGLHPVEYAIDLQTVKDVVDDFDVCLFPEKYIEKLTIYRLKRKEYEADFRNGQLSPAHAADVIRFKPRNATLRIY